MRQLPKAILSPCVLLALVLAGCGSSAPATVKPIRLLSFKSPTIPKPVLPARYTCDGKNISPPLEWGPVPAGAENLALFIVGFTPEPATKSYKIAVDWAVAGVNPSLHHMAAGHLPPGAFLGRNSDKREGYSICPKKGTGIHYQFEAYAVPQGVVLPPHFSSLAALQTLVGAKSTTRAVAHGGFAANYKRH
jgi:phosphatidylethanolamine-binding protein (PEBP) family uncharacterized protein